MDRRLIRFALVRFALGVIITDLVIHPERVRNSINVAGGVLSESLLAAQGRPPQPRPWHERVDWAQVLGGEPEGGW